MNVISLTKQLVAIPSARSSGQKTGSPEIEVSRFIEAVLAKELPPRWKIEKQYISHHRYNLFVHDDSPTRILLIGHMDVVEGGSGWSKKIFGDEDEQHLFGRGVADMKSGLAVIISTLRHVRKTETSGIAALFYCDEEYEFLGMRSFLQQNQKPHQLALALCPEPTDLGIRAGVRGVTEFHIQMHGRRGHSARPTGGVNPFRALAAIIDSLETLCKTQPPSPLGKPTLNIAGVHSGLFEGVDEKRTPLISRAANVVPDYCDALIEVRTTSSIQQKKIEETIRETAYGYKVELTSLTVPFSVGSFMTKCDDLRLIERAQNEVLGRIRYDDPATTGYSDIQIISEKWDVPCALLGPSGKNMHGVDELVSKQSVCMLEKVFHRIIDLQGESKD